MPNKELLLKIAAHIQLYPELYNQFSFTEPVEGCKTAHCIAGWACMLEKDNIAWVTRPSGKGFVPARSWSYEGQQLLGLNADEAEILFREDWTPAEGITVPAALRLLANGATIKAITNGDLEGIGEYELP